MCLSAPGAGARGPRLAAVPLRDLRWGPVVSPVEVSSIAMFEYVYMYMYMYIYIYTCIYIYIYIYM